jgi:hypothetical protein
MPDTAHFKLYFFYAYAVTESTRTRLSSCVNGCQTTAGFSVYIQHIMLLVSEMRYLVPKKRTGSVYAVSTHGHQAKINHVGINQLSR